MTVLVASTIAAYKCEDGQDTAWLAHAEAWRDAGHQFFCAVEVDQGHDHRLLPLIDHLKTIAAECWSFSINTGDRELTSGGRLVRICTGRNLAHEVFNRNPGRWEGILFLDTDVEPPVDAPERLLEVDHELVGFNVPTYCLDGPRVQQLELDGGTWRAQINQPVRGQGPMSWTQPAPFFPDDADVRMHWNTAGALLVREDAARHLRWRWDLSRGQTDDPCFQEDAVARGYGQTWVRHDVIGQHFPPAIGPLETRGHDLSIAS